MLRMLVGGALCGPAGLSLAEDEWGGLPGGSGREEVYGICSACHSLMIVQQQGLSRESWEETLIWMTEEQGMPELDFETNELILDYLATHFGVDHDVR